MRISDDVLQHLISIEERLVGADDLEAVMEALQGDIDPMSMGGADVILLGPGGRPVGVVSLPGRPAMFQFDVSGAPVAWRDVDPNDPVGPRCRTVEYRRVGVKTYQRSA